jgi:hypothetical protein
MTTPIKDPKLLTIQSTETMLELLQTYGRPLSSFHANQTIHVWNKMEKNYSYTLQEEPGKNFHPDFKPFYTPGEVLRLGSFEGKYLNDCVTEFPAEWFIDAIALGKVSPNKPDIQLNAFQILSRQPLSTWQKNNWAPHKGGKSLLGDPSTNPDERGWFQWYCRYYMGRRIPELDKKQIARWRAFTRHLGAVKKNCKPGDLTCRPRQRQALLHWAYNPFI